MDIGREEEGTTETDSQVSALLDCPSLRWGPVPAQVQGDRQEPGMGCAEIEMSGEEVSGGLGDVGLQSEDTLGLGVYVRE